VRFSAATRTAASALAIIASVGCIAPAVGAQKRALIVAVGKYADAEWAKLNSANDAVILSQSLTQHEFTRNLVVLSDASATKAAFVAAFRSQLITPAAPGDILVLTFSGHGQRLSDNDGDESDGYDEALVLHDTPRRKAAGYTGQRHLRDDELNALLIEARRKVGPQGQVFVALDSCFSGGGGRAPIALTRGSEEFDAPAPGRTGTDSASGADTQATDANLAPLVLISAAQSNEEAREARGADGKYYGSLSLALSAVLNGTRRQANYFAVHDAIARLMAAWVPNRPQLEGAREQLLFSGQAVPQEPYYTVLGEPNPAGIVWIKGGGLHGILPNAQVAFYPSGTATPSAAARLARGIVSAAEASSASVRITEKKSGALLGNAWAMVEEYSFGDVHTRVSVAPQAPDRKALEQMLSAFPLVTVVQSAPDVRFEAAANSATTLVGVQTSTDTITFTDSGTDAQRRTERVRGFLRDYTRSTYLRKLEMLTPGFDVEVEMVPCTIGSDNKCAATIPRADALSAGGRFGIRVGNGFKLLLANRSATDFYVAVLDISPENAIYPLWPRNGLGPEKLMHGLPAFKVDEFAIPEPAGTAMLKLIVTTSPVSFGTIVSENWIDSGKGPLDGLFADALSGKATTPAFPTHSVAIRSYVYDITH
jgi:metacaspase-1